MTQFRSRVSGFFDLPPEYGRWYFSQAIVRSFLVVFSDPGSSYFSHLIMSGHIDHWVRSHPLCSQGKLPDMLHLSHPGMLEYRGTFKADKLESGETCDGESTDRQTGGSPDGAGGRSLVIEAVIFIRRKD